MPARINSAAAKAATTAQLSSDRSQFFFAGTEPAGAESAASEWASLDFEFPPIVAAGSGAMALAAVLMFDAPLG
jgi:hypothetical protein